MTNAPRAITPAELMAYDPNSRQAYFNTLPPERQAAELAAYRTFQASMARSYMKQTVRKRVVCPTDAGGAMEPAYGASTMYTFNVPTSNDAFLEGFEVHVNLNLSLAAGTSAVYQLNAAAPLNVIDRIVLDYGGSHHHFRPYILEHLGRLMGYQRPGWPFAVLAGQVTTPYETWRKSSGYPVATGTNNWHFKLFIPLNLLHPQDPRGMVPIMGGETQARIRVTTPTALLGNDAINNPVSAVSGSGHAATVGANSTIKVVAVYRDGTSFAGRSKLGLDLTGLPTAQIALDNQLNIPAANNLYRQKIGVMDRIMYYIAAAYDGVSPTRLAATSNIQAIELSQDSGGNNVFWRYGVGTNMPVEEYLGLDIPLQIGQDLDEGVIPFVAAPIFQEADASSLEGTNFLYTGLETEGWTDVNYGVQFGTVGTNGAPRVETHVIFLNSRGLVSL